MTLNEIIDLSGKLGSKMATYRHSDSKLMNIFHSNPFSYFTENLYHFLHPQLANILTGIGKCQVLFLQFVVALMFINENCNSNAKAVTFIFFLCALVQNAYAIDVFEIDIAIAKNAVCGR